MNIYTEVRDVYNKGRLARASSVLSKGVYVVKHPLATQQGDFGYYPDPVLRETGPEPGLNGYDWARANGATEFQAVVVWSWLDQQDGHGNYTGEELSDDQQERIDAIWVRDLTNLQAIQEMVAILVE